MTPKKTVRCWRSACEGSEGLDLEVCSTTRRRVRVQIFELYLSHHIISQGGHVVIHFLTLFTQFKISWPTVTKALNSKY